MKPERKIFISLASTLLVICSSFLIYHFFVFENTNKEKTVQVKEDGLAITLISSQSDKTLTISTTLKNISSETKTLQFPNPCMRGHYYRTSEEFHLYFKTPNKVCVSVIDEVSLLPNEELHGTFTYEIQKTSFFKSIDIWPGRQQKEIALTL